LSASSEVFTLENNLQNREFGFRSNDSEIMSWMRRRELGIDAPMASSAEIHSQSVETITFNNETSHVCGGIIIDETGSSKAQVFISLLSGSRQASFRIMPTLLVCSPSELQKWEVDLNRLCPGLRILKYHGGHSAALFNRWLTDIHSFQAKQTSLDSLDRLEYFDVILTTYERLKAKEYILPDALVVHAHEKSSGERFLASSSSIWLRTRRSHSRKENGSQASAISLNSVGIAFRLLNLDFFSKFAFTLIIMHFAATFLTYCY
jgi:SNF2 family DNA or RNA helicase